MQKDQRVELTGSQKCCRITKLNVYFFFLVAKIKEIHLKKVF